MPARVTGGLKKLIVIAAGALTGTLLCLLVTQFILVRAADIRLDEYADGLLDYAVDIALAKRRVIASVNSSHYSPCSDSDLVRMRNISFTSWYFRDIGRFENGAVTCTALWDILPRPKMLPPPDRALDNYYMLWQDISGIGRLEGRADMLGQNSVILFTSPVMFSHYDSDDNDYKSMLVTRDGAYVYRTFGDAKDLEAAPIGITTLWYSLSPTRFTSSCADQIDICIVASLDNVDMAHMPSLMLALIVLLGAGAGGSITYATYLSLVAEIPLAERIRRALAANRLTVVYQPLVRVRDGQLAGVEALVRLRDESGEPIPPDVFIKEAEEQELIGDITRRVIRITLEEMGPTMRARPDFHCSINLSVADVLDPRLCDDLDAQVRRNRLRSGQVALEITERSTADHERMIAGMQTFRARGYQFHIDDFGTGYSSLAYLARLPINGIKIDRAFTHAIGTEAVSATIVQNISAIAEKLNLDLVVEGIETREQADYIKTMNPNAIGQGWFYGKPMPAQQLTTQFMGAGARKFPT